MKKVFIFVLFQFFLYSCASNYGKERYEKRNNLTGKDGVTISCKPQREILVKGKCIKRRGFM